MEENLEVGSRVVIPGSELGFTASRSGGPGGQHVNKTSTRVTLEWNLKETNALSEDQKTRALASLGGRVNKDGVLKIHVDDTRSQKQNRETVNAWLVTEADMSNPPLQSYPEWAWQEATSYHI